MKKNLLSYALIVLFSLFIISCNKDDDPSTIQKGEVEFGFSLKDITKGKSAKADATEPATLILSIKDASGNLVYDTERIELLNMNGYLISKPLSLLVGNYTLGKFLVVDEEDNVIYASPLEGSDLAYLVQDPLPINFDVTKDETLKLVPEVLSTENVTPEDFGYTTFSFEVVETFDFLLSVFVYSETAENFELTDAHLNINAEGTSIYSDTLQAITNKIMVNDGFETYVLTVEKEGYTAYVDTFTNSELKLYFSSEDNGPLVIILEDKNFKNISFVTDQSTSKMIEILVQGTSGENITINWGDNSDFENITFSNEIITLNHTYKGTDEYEIKISGAIENDLSELNISWNRITSINVNEAKGLKKLYLHGNLLTSFNISNLSQLNVLRCSYNNNIETLNITSNLAIKELGIFNTKIPYLDLSNHLQLTTLICGGENFTSLDISNNINMKDLTLNNTNISSLDLTKNNNLESLHLHNNNLVNIDLSNNIHLTSLDISNNVLSSVNLSNNPLLTKLWCNNNNLTTIDISNQSLLNYFDCSYNNLSTLNFSNNRILETINCSFNVLETIDVSACDSLNGLMSFNNNLSSIVLSDENTIRRLQLGHNNFNSENINAILANILAGVIENTRIGSLYLNYNSAPTGQGLIDKNELVNTFGWSVRTD